MRSVPARLLCGRDAAWRQRCASRPEVGQRGVIQDACRRVTNVQQYLIEGAMLLIPLHQLAKSFGIPQWRQRSVDGADDLAQENLLRSPPQPVPPVGATKAFHQA